MIPQGFGAHRRSNDHHILLGFIAVVVSVIAHLIGVYFVSDLILSGASSTREKSREWFDSERVPPMRVEMMRSDPMQIAKKVEGERNTPNRGPIEASDNVDSLSESANVVLTVPPPIPREALAPGVPTPKEVITEQIDAMPWMPRQEIAQIFDRTVQDEVATLPRREIPLIERVPQAPDIVPSIDLSGRKFGRDPEPPKPLEAAEVFDTEVSRGTFAIPVAELADVTTAVSLNETETRLADKVGEIEKPQLDTQQLAAQSEQLEKQMEEVSRQAGKEAFSEEERRARHAQAQIAVLQESVKYLPMDDMLAVGIETFRAPEEPGHLYFRIGIQPRADRVAQVIAKDLLIVQDVSGSIGEERMRFCRNAISEALKTLNTGDRFNVVAFRDTFETCFREWAPASPENIKQGLGFIGSMRAFGMTDLFGSLRSMLRLQRDPLRPMVVIVVTDGDPTTGLTESAEIIGEFSRINNGIASVYMFGIHNKANAYLMDMVSYCNRGAATILNGNRWDIPKALQPVYEGIRNPIMSDIGVAFDSASECEIYPRQSTNLYKDQQLVLYGICAEGTEELVFQLRGLAADQGYDTIFRLNLARQARPGTAALRQRWAMQKMYYLVGVYSRDPKPEILTQLRELHEKYGIQIPYASELKETR